MFQAKVRHSRLMAWAVDSSICSLLPIGLCLKDKALRVTDTTRSITRSSQSSVIFVSMPALLFLTPENWIGHPSQVTVTSRIKHFRNEE